MAEAAEAVAAHHNVFFFVEKFYLDFVHDILFFVVESFLYYLFCILFDIVIFSLYYLHSIPVYFYQQYIYSHNSFLV